jgi:hypothetical protein
MSWARDLEAVVGRRGAWVAGAAVALGAVAFSTGLGEGRAPRTFGALIASWLFFTGAALGAVAFGAFFRIIPARWARPMVALGRPHAAFGPVGLVLLGVIVAGAKLAPWVANGRGWLAPPLLVGRQLLLNAILFGLAFLWFGRRPRATGGPPLAAAVTFCIAYTVVLSVWGFDFVLGPDPIFGSTIIGPYVFVGAFLAGTSLLTLLALSRGELSDSARHDAVSLLFALSIFWMYLFAAQFLTIWYGNLSDETGFLLRRMADGWGWIGLAMLTLVFVAPFVGLLHPAGRRSPAVLATVLAAQLVGLWLNCQLLVVPSFPAGGRALPIGLRNGLIALGVLGAFVLSVAPGLRRDAATSG